MAWTWSTRGFPLARFARIPAMNVIQSWAWITSKLSRAAMRAASSA